MLPRSLENSFVLEMKGSIQTICVLGMTVVLIGSAFALEVWLISINPDSPQASKIEGFSSQEELKKLAKHLNPNHVTHCFQSGRRADEINLKPPQLPCGACKPQCQVREECRKRFIFMWTCNDLDSDHQGHSAPATEQPSEGADF